MPVKELMTWVASRKQWAKKLPVKMQTDNNKNRMIYVGKRKLQKLYPDLFEHPTRVGSRAAANQYWLDIEEKFREQQSEYDNAIATRQDILLAEILNIKRFVEDRGGIEALKTNSKEIFESYHSLFDEKLLQEVAEQQQELIQRKETGVNFEETVRHNPDLLELPDIPMLESIIPNLGVPRKSKLEGAVEEFLKREIKRIDLNPTNKRKISKGRYDNKKRMLMKSIKCLGDIHIDKLMEAEISKHFDYIDRLDISEISKRDHLSVFNEFLNWSFKNGIKKELPRNWDDSKFKFSADKKTPDPATVAEAHYVIKALRNKNKPLLELAVLLHINCGMESGNIADLLKSEIDLKEGTLTYKRNKADKHNQIKPVTYPLWKRTIELLKSLESDHKELWLLNENGKHLNIGETGSRTDNIGQNFTRFKKKFAKRYTKALTDFRKTGSTELKELGYRDLEDQFLQHGANTTTDQWYSGQFRERFNEGVRKLEPLFEIKDKQKRK